MRAAAGAAPTLEENRVTFRVPDPDRTLAAVRLCQEVARPRTGPAFTFGGGEWRLSFPRPNADRMEYQLLLVREDGSEDIVCDPGNPLRAPGPFGDRSVVEFPGYAPPAWMDGPDPPATEPIPIGSRILRSQLRCEMWSPPGVASDDRAPLLVVHDGIDYALYSSLTAFLTAKIADGALPPLRAALLGPVERNDTYSASAAYAAALATEILPALARRAPAPPGREYRVGMGASLGALAMLHVHRKHTASFGALFLQSGSFFRQRTDRQEVGFVRFRRIARFVGTILAVGTWAYPVPVAATCGRAEENLANNRALYAALGRQGYDVDFREVPDAHNWVAWRDAFDPALTLLLQRTWT